jgi:hypothetical protein
LKEWASNNKAFVHKPKQDPDKLGAVSKILAYAHWIICGAAGTQASESTQRRGVDILVELAFALRRGASHEVRFVFRFLPPSTTNII